MAVKKNTDQILVRPVRRVNKVLVIRDIVFIAVVTFFIIVSYSAHLQMVAFLVAEFAIALFLIWSTLVKMFVGQSFIQMMYFNIKRERKWKLGLFMLVQKPVPGLEI